jgi:acetyl-CoA acetyltransferase
MSMSMRSKVAIVGYAETPYSRPKTKDDMITGDEYFGQATEQVLKQVGLSKSDLDGQGLGVAGTIYPHAEIWSTEVAQNLGVSPRIMIRGDQGGATGAAMLIQAACAINSGLVDTFLCVCGDAPTLTAGGGGLGGRTWRYEGDFWMPIGMMGPNSEFSFVMRRHMHQYGTTAEQLGRIAVSQRHNASRNPNAYLRSPITLEDYLNSKVIADPIKLLDCCIAVNGGLAFIVTSAEKAQQMTDKPVYLQGFGEADNYTGNSRNRPDMTVTGIKVAAKDAYEMAGTTARDMSFAQIYDDYTIAVLMQLEDAGFCKKGEGGAFLEDTDMRFNGQLPVNTHGGQLSAGQPGIGGGFGHIVEAVRQLRGEGGERQVKNAGLGLVTSAGGIAHGGNLVCTIAMVFGNEAT